MILSCIDEQQIATSTQPFAVIRPYIFIDTLIPIEFQSNLILIDSIDFKWYSNDCFRFLQSHGAPPHTCEKGLCQSFRIKADLLGKIEKSGSGCKSRHEVDDCVSYIEDNDAHCVNFEAKFLGGPMKPTHSEWNGKIHASKSPNAEFERRKFYGDLHSISFLLFENENRSTAMVRGTKSMWHAMKRKIKINKNQALLSAQRVCKANQSLKKCVIFFSPSLIVILCAIPKTIWSECIRN